MSMMSDVMMHDVCNTTQQDSYSYKPSLKSFWTSLSSRARLYSRTFSISPLKFSPRGRYCRGGDWGRRPALHRGGHRRGVRYFATATAVRRYTSGRATTGEIWSGQRITTRGRHQAGVDSQRMRGYHTGLHIRRPMCRATNCA